MNKLEAHKDMLTIRTIPSPTLHGKLLAIEGAGGQGREPYLAVVSGSPNFTAAALLQTPPVGNSETAVVLLRKGGKGEFAKMQEGLEIETRFEELLEWDSLKQQPLRALPSVVGQLVIADALLVLLKRRVELVVQSAPTGTTSLVVRTTGSRGSMEVARGPFPGEVPWTADAGNLVDCNIDGRESVVAASLVVEALGEGDVFLASTTVPLNVDHPEQFCGCTVFGSLAVTLDDRIARSGLGVPVSYRAQQQIIESFRAQQKEMDGTSPAPSHQADLDRLYRNLHYGLRGLQHRFDRAPDSKHLLRKSATDLAEWCKEAISLTSGTYSTECRLYMADTLLEAILDLIEKAKRSPKLAGEVHGVLNIAGLMELVTDIKDWLASSCGGEDLGSFVATCRQKADDLGQHVGAKT